MQHLTHATACFPLVFHFLFHGKCRSHGAGLVYHMIFQEVHTHRRKEVESKHHGTVKELTSEHQRFDWTEYSIPWERMEAIFVVVWVVDLFLRSGRLAGWQTKISLFTGISKIL